MVILHFEDDIMAQIRTIFLIAGNTVTGVLRGVVLNVLLVLAALMILAATSTSTFEQGQARPMLVDSGLAFITVMGAMIAILTGFILIPREIETRTLYPLISKPVRRWQFVLGKFLGAIGINGITVGLLAILFFGVFFLKFKTFDGNLLLAVVMIYAMLVVLSGLILFFSTFMSWIGTIIVSMVVWFISSYSLFLRDLSNSHGDAPMFSKVMFQVVQKLLPNFQAMDLRMHLIQNGGIPIELRQLLDPLAGNLLYLVIALALAILIFNYREV